MKVIIIITLIQLIFTASEGFTKLRKPSASAISRFIKKYNWSNDMCLYRCTTIPDTLNDYCNFYVGSEEYLNQFFQCSKDQSNRKYCKGVSDGDVIGRCVSLKRFYGEKCNKDADCQSGKCVDTKCAYLNDGDQCQNDKDCGKNSYCQSDPKLFKSFCKPYVNEEGGDCVRYKVKCSPHFYCNNNSKCELRGKLADGEKPEDKSLCKSFHTDMQGLCSSEECTDLDDPFTCTLDKKIAEKWPTIDWNTEKHSDYDGRNIGVADVIDMNLNEEIEVLSFLCDEEVLDCLKPILKEGHVLQTYDAYNVDRITDNDIRELLDYRPTPIN